jgi:hypothetical protein
VLHLEPGPGVLRLIIEPLDRGVGERWEVDLDKTAMGGLQLGELVVRPVRVFRAEPREP